MVIRRPWLAVVLTRQGLFDRARTLLRETLGAMPSPHGCGPPATVHAGGILLSLGNVEYRSQNFQQAETDYRQALALCPAWPDAASNLAMAREAAGTMNAQAAGGKIGPP